MRIKIIIFFTVLNFNILNAETSSIDSNKIFKNLRCLICQGQSVADSNSEFAQTIKLVVKDQINDGKSEFYKGILLIELDSLSKGCDYLLKSSKLGFAAGSSSVYNNFCN